MTEREKEIILFTNKFPGGAAVAQLAVKIIFKNPYMGKDKRRYADRATYLKVAVDKRRKAIKSKALEYGGGKCALCGYNRCVRALEFHHKDSKEKDFGLSAKGYTRSWEKVKQELQKCILLCANCHREVHDGIAQLSPVMEIEKTR